MGPYLDQGDRLCTFTITMDQKKCFDSKFNYFTLFLRSYFPTKCREIYSIKMINQFSLYLENDGSIFRLLEMELLITSCIIPRRITSMEMIVNELFRTCLEKQGKLSFQQIQNKQIEYKQKYHTPQDFLSFDSSLNELTILC